MTLSRAYPIRTDDDDFKGHCLKPLGERPIPQRPCLTELFAHRPGLFNLKTRIRVPLCLPKFI